MNIPSQVLESDLVWKHLYKWPFSTDDFGASSTFEIDSVGEKCSRNAILKQKDVIMVDGNQKSGCHSPVEVGSLSHDLQGFLHPWWLG